MVAQARPRRNWWPTVIFGALGLTVLSSCAGIVTRQIGPPDLVLEWTAGGSQPVGTFHNTSGHALPNVQVLVNERRLEGRGGFVTGVQSTLHPTGFGTVDPNDTRYYICPVPAYRFPVDLKVTSNGNELRVRQVLPKY